MKRGIGTGFLGFFVLISFLIVGCGGDGSSPPSSQPLTSTTAQKSGNKVSNSVSEIVRIAKGSLVLQGRLRPQAYPSSNIAIVKEKAFAAQASSTCPSITGPETPSSNFIIVIDYGTGCIDSFDGVQRSGRIAITVTNAVIDPSEEITSGLITLTFTDFMLNQTSIGGSASIEVVSATSETWDMNLTQSDGQETETLIFEAAVTYSDATDLEEINGGGSFVSSVDGAFNFSLTDLQYDFETTHTPFICTDPIGGRMTLSAGTHTATLIFGVSDPGCGSVFISIDGGENTLVFLDTSSQPSIAWRLKAAMPTPRYEFGVAVVNKKLYAIGGSSGSTLSTVEEYDPATDTWTRKADMPTARRKPIVVTVNDKIYAIGGLSYTDPNQITYIQAIEEYDALTDTWVSKGEAPLPPASNTVLGNQCISGGALNGKIYLFIFNSTLPLFTATYEYDPVTETWNEKDPIPFPHSCYAVASINNKLYVLSTPFQTAFSVTMGFGEYDPAEDTWIIKSPPVGIHHEFGGLVSLNEKIYAVGGRGDTFSVGPFTAVSEYDISTDRWVAKSPMQTARHSLGVASVLGKLYAIGGSGTHDLFSPTPLSIMEEGVIPEP